MARKPENTFYESVHRHFASKEVPHREKMNNPYNSGTADVWYSGKGGDAWIEYKFVVVPKRATTMIVPDLSALQLRWLKGRHDEGRNVHVLVGCADGGVWFQRNEWESGITQADFLSRLQTRKQIANVIQSMTLIE